MRLLPLVFPLLLAAALTQVAADRAGLDQQAAVAGKTNLLAAALTQVAADRAGLDQQAQAKAADKFVNSLILRQEVSPHLPSGSPAVEGRSIALNVSALLQQQYERPGQIEADRYVLIRGAQGINAVAINGDYKAAGTYNGKTLFQKETDANTWLRYVTAKGLNQWRVSGTDSMHQNNDLGFMYSAQRGLNDPADAHQWFVWIGSAWELQDSVVAISEGSVGSGIPPEPSVAPAGSHTRDNSSYRVVHKREKGRGPTNGELQTVRNLHWFLFFSLATLPTALFLWMFCAWRTGKAFPLAIPSMLVSR